MSEPPNAAQVAYWNDTAGRTWADLQELIDRQLEPLGARGIRMLAPAAGERILDVGCGAGATTLALARAVGPTGAVVGVDISRPLLDRARHRALCAANVSFIEADAQTHAFALASFDAVFSRFGVMFFAEPAAAFANLRRALKPGGRLAFICWRTPAESPIMTLPAQAAAPHLPPLPPPEPDAPGPFAFADPDRVRRILAEAGLEAVEITPHDELIGSGDLETSLRLARNIGPLSRILRENPHLADKAMAAVRDALAPHEGPDGVKLNAAVWIVRARAPG
jgi:SAM-dependent methyltransferase